MGQHRGATIKWITIDNICRYTCRHITYHQKDTCLPCLTGKNCLNSEAKWSVFPPQKWRWFMEPSSGHFIAILQEAFCEDGGLGSSAPAWSIVTVFPKHLLGYSPFWLAGIKFYSMEPLRITWKGLLNLQILQGIRRDWNWPSTGTRLETAHWGYLPLWQPGIGWVPSGKHTRQRKTISLYWCSTKQFSLPCSIREDYII